MRVVGGGRGLSDVVSSQSSKRIAQIFELLRTRGEAILEGRVFGLQVGVLRLEGDAFSLEFLYLGSRLLCRSICRSLWVWLAMCSSTLPIIVLTSFVFRSVTSAVSWLILPS